MNNTKVSKVKSYKGQSNPVTVNLLDAIANATRAKDKVSSECITPNCIYKYLDGKKQVVAFSQYIFVDIDTKHNLHFAPLDLYNQVRNIVNVALVKWSYSGTGIHCLIRSIANNQKEFNLQYLAIIDDFGDYCINLDTSCNDSTRLMFLAPDPKMYINKNAVPYPSFAEVVEVEEVKPKRKRYSKEYDSNNVKPWELYNSIDDWQSVLCSHGWSTAYETAEKIYFKRDGSTNPQSGNFSKSKNCFWSWSDDTQLESNKPYSPFDLLKELECNGDTAKAANKVKELLSLT